jgi:von Willebrand factor type A domain
MKSLLFSLLLLNSYFQCARPGNPIPTPPPPVVVDNPTVDTRKKIQVALLLDTSNSMDGLIEQAKAQLWKMVNRLSSAKKDNQETVLEIALFEYGNSNLNVETGYIRMVQPLSVDLDGLSEKLFELRTQGGDEYCGQVIQSAEQMLPWSQEPNTLKIMVIAGNEPFDQGTVNFRRACSSAQQKGIIINTIHCGDYKKGVQTFWSEGATIGNGKYMNIDTDQKVVHVSTPYDGKIIELNERLNKTYIGYGATGEYKKERQVAQDRNAETYGAANAVQRATAKSKSSYSNADWDLVDASENDQEFASKLKKEELPESLRNKSYQELQKAVRDLSDERKAIKKELLEQEQLMQAYIKAQSASQTATATLDMVLIQTVVEQARALGYQID